MPAMTYATPREYNPRGDVANGITGSNTSGSIRNAVMQRPAVKGGQNPFSDMLMAAREAQAQRWATSQPVARQISGPVAPKAPTPAIGAFQPGGPGGGIPAQPGMPNVFMTPNGNRYVSSEDPAMQNFWQDNPATAPPPATSTGGGTVSSEFISGPTGGIDPYVPPQSPTGPIIPPDAGPTPAQPPGFADTLRTTLSQLEELRKPQFAKDRDDLQRRLAQAGAVSGQIDSGGYVPVVNEQLSSLMAKQGAMLGDEASQIIQSQQQIAGPQYIAELGAMVQREQIRTNADLEKAAQSLQKYGIDANQFMEQYKADLALQGIKYSANQGVRAASLQAAGSRAMAGASLQGQKYDADIRRELGILGYDVERENNLMNNYIRIAALGPDWARLMLGTTPESLYFGAPPPGGDIVVR